MNQDLAFGGVALVGALILVLGSGGWRRLNARRGWSALAAWVGIIVVLWAIFALLLKA